MINIDIFKAVRSIKEHFGSEGVEDRFASEMDLSRCSFNRVIDCFFDPYGWDDAVLTTILCSILARMAKRAEKVGYDLESEIRECFNECLKQYQK